LLLGLQVASFHTNKECTISWWRCFSQIMFIFTRR